MMTRTKLMVAAAAAALATVGGGQVAQAAPGADNDAQLTPSCSSGGLVDKKTDGSPVGVYGGGHIRCTQAYPSPVNTVFVEVTLRQDGVAKAYDKAQCGLPTTGGGCSAGTPITHNPDGNQNWCADVLTTSAWGYEHRRSYCNAY